MELYGYATYSNMSLLNTSSAQIIVFFIVVLKKICLILTKFIENIDRDYFSVPEAWEGALSRAVLQNF